jgi:hypothetical protein
LIETERDIDTAKIVVVLNMPKKNCEYCGNSFTREEWEKTCLESSGRLDFYWKKMRYCHEKCRCKAAKQRMKLRKNAPKL